MAGQRALLVVDVQRGFEDPALGPRDNPHAEENVAKLIAAWRAHGEPIVVVQHDWQGGPAAIYARLARAPSHIVATICTRSSNGVITSMPNRSIPR